jgi:RNA polymerase sigma factor (sigma-70 family)
MTRAPHRARLAAASRPAAQHKLAVKRIGQLLGEWRARELRIARSFRECRGLNTEQLEDIYQETAVSLLHRHYQNEEHLRNALRDGFKKRALNMHRNRRRRGEILKQNAPSLLRSAQEREDQNTPELAALAQQDRSMILKFFTTLSSDEQCVFWLTADGMRYRAIAPELDMEVNEARKVARSCERKRERFQLIYEAKYESRQSAREIT